MFSVSNFIAPELLDKKVGAPLKPDIYSLGVVLYAMMNLYVPNAAEVAEMNEKGYKSAAFSEDLCSLLNFVLQHDASKRPTIN